MFFLATTYVLSYSIPTSFATQHIGGNIIYESWQYHVLSCNHLCI